MGISPDQFREMEARTARNRGEVPAPSSQSAVDRERDLHDDLEKHCLERGFLYVHSRMDVPSTIAVGHPDFTVFMPGRKTCFLECKAKDTKTTINQLAKVAHARKLGFVAEVVDNMPDALAALERARSC